MMRLRRTLLLLSLVLLWALPVQATVTLPYTDGFENHLTPNWENSSVCAGNPQDGCNPAISSGNGFGGTKSLRSSLHCAAGLSSATGGCGTYVNLSHTPASSVYMKWRQRLIGWTTNQNVGSKMMYNKCCSGNNYLTFWHIFQGQNHIGVQVIPDSNAANFQFFCPSLGRNDQGCNYYQNKGTGPPIDDGNWHCIETHVSTGTPGTQTGLIEVWEDGTLTLQYPNIWVAHYTGGLFNEVTHYAQLGQGDRDIDDFVVSTTRIGCAGPPPPPDTTPPTNPNGLTAIGGSLSVSLSHTASTDASSPITYIHERCTGAGCSNFAVIDSGTSTSFVHAGLAASTSYSFRVKAQDPTGNQSGYTNTATAITASSSAGGSFGINGTGQFVLNGTQTFLLGVSYFDATQYKTADLDTLAARGFNLLRAWATWNVDTGHGSPNRSVCDLNGALKVTERDQLQAFINYAKTKNQVVMLVILDINTPTLMTTDGARQACITNVVNYYKPTSAQANWNVMFDVINEHDTITTWSTADTAAEIKAWTDTGFAACPTCLIYASATINNNGFGDFIGPNDTTSALTAFNKSNVTTKIVTNAESILAVHEARSVNWYSVTGARVAAYRAHLATLGKTGTPVMFDEPQRDVTEAQYLSAVTQAKAAGAAAWVFHNQKSFDLRTLPIFSQFSADEAAFTVSAAGALAGSSGTPTVLAASSDTFTRADNADLGTSWSPAYAARNPLNLVSNKIRALATTNESVELYMGAVSTPTLLYSCTGANEGPPPTGFTTLAGHGLKRFTATSSCGQDTVSVGAIDASAWSSSFNADQWAQGTLSTLPTGTNVDFPSLVVRAQASTGGYDNLYNATIYANGTNYTIEINKYVTGVQTTIGATYTGSVSVNDVFLLTAVGSQITLYQNGVARNTATDTSISTGGYIGFGSFRSAIASVARWKNFSGGNYVASFATPNNQGRTVEIGGLAGAVTAFGQIRLRSSSPTENGYACEWTTNPSTAQIRRKDSGASSNLTSSTAVSTWIVGDVIGCFANGSTIYMTRGSVTSAPILSVTDTTYSSGSTGLYAHVGSTGAVANLELDNTVGYEFTTVPAACTPQMTSATLDLTGANVTWNAACTPTQIRIRWDTGSLIEPIASFVLSGATYRYTKTGGWAPGTSFVCFDAIDAQGVVNTNLNDIRCNSISVPYDQTPPVLSNGLPSAHLPAGTTAWPISADLDKFAACKYDTTDTTYVLMANTMSVASLTASATVSGLTNGSTHTYYLRCSFDDIFQVAHPNLSSLVITVIVDSSTSDSTPPSTVTGLVGTAISESQIQLDWTPATDNVAVSGYQTYNCTDVTCTTIAVSGNAGNQTFIQRNVAPASTTFWCTKAIDSSNNFSAACSNVATVTTPAILDVTPPSDMTNLRLIAAFSLSVILAWDQGTDNAGPVMSNIEQCQGAACTTFALVPPGGIQGTTLLTTLIPNTLYRFRGKHCDFSGNCSINYSNILDVTTAAGGLGQPRVGLSFGQDRTVAGTRTQAGTRTVRP